MTVFSLQTYPSAWLFAFSVVLMMTGLYRSDPIVTAEGGVLLIGTTYYVGKTHAN